MRRGDTTDLEAEIAALRQENTELRQSLAAVREAQNKEARLNQYLAQANNLLDQQLFEKTIGSKVLELAEVGDDLAQFCRGLLALIAELVGVSWVGVRLSRQGHASAFQEPANAPKSLAMLEAAAAGRSAGAKAFVYRFGRGEATFGHLVALPRARAFTEDDRRILEAICQEASGPLEHNLLILLLREMASFQADFVNMLSHDLRNPLTGVISSLSTTRMPGLTLSSEIRDGLIDTALASARAVNEMISDLLDVAKLEAGRMRIQREPVDLRAIAESALEPLHAVAKLKRLTLVLVAEPGLPPVPGDASKLKRVFANLVANALKYTAKGGVLVSLDRREDHVEVTVADTGLGIPAEAQSRLFEKFYQVADRGQGGGTGLGLAFCRQMIEAHGGAIWVESPSREAAESGRIPGADPEAPGATFRFTLPLH